MEPEIAERVRRGVGWQPTAWLPVEHQGFTGNQRWIVEFDNGRSAFVKAAVDEMTAAWLRSEYRVYSRIQGPFLPQMLGWDPGGDFPLLILEDLSVGVWPPPWTGEFIRAVQASLDDVHASPSPDGLPSLEDQRDELSGWHQVAANPDPFLSLGLCTERWLAGSLSTLLAASDDCVLQGKALLHMDVRSDNVCIRGGRALLVDWNWASIGNPTVDVATWLPSLSMEGGPSPEDILPEAAPEAAIVSGFFAARAGLPPPADEPGAVPGQWERIRAVQLAQLREALPWSARSLELPQPDGPLRTT
jgi:phosphotransferase family enzyme